MGVTVREILNSKFFMEYSIVAGGRGLDREVQAATVFDAPDGYKWIKGKEFILSTGYLFINNTEFLMEVIQFLHNNNCTALGIKTDRYLKTIPEEAIKLADSLSFPLIHIPYDEAWVDIINAVNSLAINRFVKALHYINQTDNILVNVENLNKKIQNIVSCLHKELKSPISIVDFLAKKVTTCPKAFKADRDSIGMNQFEDFTFTFKKEIICDKLNIYRITDLENSQRSPWIVMPIFQRGQIMAKIIVHEETRNIDYYEVISLRVASVLLTEIYEQIYLINLFEDRYYDDLINSLIKGELDTSQKVMKVAYSLNNFAVNVENKFVCFCIKQEEGRDFFIKVRDKINNALLFNQTKGKYIFGVPDSNTILIIYDSSKFENPTKSLMEIAKDLIINLKSHMNDFKFKMGIGSIIENISNIRKSYLEALKAIEIGGYIYPERNIISFEELGPFVFFELNDFHKNCLDNMFKIIQPILQQENSHELMTTLLVYLEN